MLGLRAPAGAPAGVEAFARQGVTRLVVGVAATDLDQQRRDLEAFAKLHALV